MAARLLVLAFGCVGPWLLGFVFGASGMFYGQISFFSMQCEIKACGAEQNGGKLLACLTFTGVLPVRLNLHPLYLGSVCSLAMYQ
jgi:hypothetical protein